MSTANVVGEAREESLLPVPLRVEVQGKVVQSNIDLFRSMVMEWVEEINDQPATDEEFAEAESNIKRMKAAESAIIKARERAIRQAEEVRALFDTLDETGEIIKEPRLRLERIVKQRKLEIRAEIVEAAVSEIIEPHGEHYREQIEEAIKGRRSVAKMQEAAGHVVFEANDTITTSREILNKTIRLYGRGLVPDYDRLVRMPANELRPELEMRAERRRAEEAQRKADAERREREAAERRAREAEEKARRDLEAKLEAEKAETLRKMKENMKTHKSDSAQPEVITYDAPPWDEPEADPEPAARTPSHVEMEVFRSSVMQAFAVVKAAKKALQNDANIDRANRFAEAVNAAWKEHMVEA